MDYLTFIKKYNAEHSHCPKCHSENLMKNLLGFIYNEDNPEEYKNKNAVRCQDCGWRGIVHDCVKE